MTQIRDFTLDISGEQLDDLHRRIDATRWPEKEAVDDWSQGVPLSAMQDLMAYWRNEYDWRRCEAKLNQFGQFITEIDGLDIHFLHVRSPHENAMPMVLTHGWPGSVVEFMDVIGPLTDPVAYGGKADDAFHLVIPSLPGFGFSGKPEQHGWNIQKIGRAWAELMNRLGYDRWVAQGGDWGAAVTHVLGQQAPEGLCGVHCNLVFTSTTSEDYVDPSPAAKEAIAAGQHYSTKETGYSIQQATRPQTIGYSLVDSPVGQAAWIYEKMMTWTDNQGRPEDALSRDAILDNIMLYWLPATGAAAARLYWESFASIDNKFNIALPAGVSNFPKEIIKAPREWAERVFSDIVYWNDCEKGGHFAAWEQPDLFVDEIRSCFALMR